MAGKISPRWAFMQVLTVPDRQSPNDIYLKRLRVVQTPWAALYVHWIYRSDADRDVHDHPWGFFTWIVRGGYTEEVAARPGRFGDVRRKRVWPKWSVHRFPYGQAHRIISIHPRTMTVVLVGKRRSNWGFYTPTGFIPWQEYR